MPTFAVTYRYVDQPERLDEHRPEHRTFLRSLHEHGTILLSGPFTEGPAGALLITRGESAEQIRSALDDDPFHREELIAERTLRPWNIVVGSLEGSH